MILAERLHKRFGEVTAVHDVSFEVGRGEILALLGPNGAGKTTIIRMLSALLMPTSGRAVVAGYDTRREPNRVRGSVGLLTEAPGLYLRMQAQAYVEFFGELQRVPRAALEVRLEALFRRFGLWEQRHRPLYSFSKGMRQKAALVRALIHEPPVVFLDEPTSALDPASAKSVRDYVRELRDEGRTVLVCTHNLAEAEVLADRIAIVRGGRVVAHGAPAELRRQLRALPAFEAQLRDDARRYLAALDGYFEQAVCDGPVLRYTTADPLRHNPAIVAALVRAGAQIVSLREVDQGLEAVYLRLVEGEAATSLEPLAVARERALEPV